MRTYLTTQHHPNRAVPFSHNFFKGFCCTCHMSSANQCVCLICGKAFPTKQPLSAHAWHCGVAKNNKGCKSQRSVNPLLRSKLARKSRQEAADSKRRHDSGTGPIFYTPKKGQVDTVSRAIKSKGQVVTVYRAVRSRSNSAAHRIRHLFP